MEPTSTRPKIDSIQWLRGLAALIVLVCHADAAANVAFQKDAIPFSEYGINGVDIFFIISGFIMFITTVNARKTFSPSDFMVRRLIRVAPTYWLYSILFFSLYFIMPSLFSHAVMTWPDLLQSLAFIPHYNAVGELSPVMAVGWTLNFEMFFYIVFCLVRSQTNHLILPLTVSFSSLVAVGLAIDFKNAALLSFTRPLLFEFLFGCCIAWLFVNKWRVPPVTTISILAVALGLSFYLPTVIPDNGSVSSVEYWRFVARGVPSALLVFAICCGTIKDVWNIKAILFLGDISYSLYLTHTLTLRAVFAVYKHLPIARANVLLADGVAILVSIAAAIVAYLLIEKPLTLGLTRIYTHVSSSRSVKAVQVPG